MLVWELCEILGNPLYFLSNYFCMTFFRELPHHYNIIDSIWELLIWKQQWVLARMFHKTIPINPLTFIIKEHFIVDKHHTDLVHKLHFCPTNHNYLNISSISLQFNQVPQLLSIQDHNPSPWHHSFHTILF